MSEEPTRGYVDQDGAFNRILDNAKISSTRPFNGGGLASASEMRGRRRVSRVVRVGEWPRDVKRRRLGFLHSQVWFYDDLPCFPTELLPVSPKEDTLRGESLGHIYRHPTDGSRWMYDYERQDWLRLYLDRRTIETPLFSLRRHVFHTGDDDSAPHDHPWWFVTLPMSDYEETIMLPFRDRGRVGYSAYRITRRVRRWRLHFRRRNFAHIVHKPARPVVTYVLTGPVARVWGFWTRPDAFLPYTEWTKYD